MTEWRDVKGYEGLYKVDENGNIKNVKRNKILVKSIHRDGYIKVILSKESKKKTYLSHRLVAIAFIDNPNNKPKVNHIDGNKQNNHISNLEWVTVSENTKHAYDIGLAKGNNGGMNKRIAKINPIDNTIVKYYDSITEASNDNNTYRRKISSVLNKNKICLGHLWKEDKINYENY